jgi:hypothetical protein
VKSKILIAYIFFVIIFDYGCSNIHSFYREKELFHLLKINNIKLPSGNSVVILLVGSGCNTCLESTKEILKQLPYNQIRNMTVILGGELAQKEFSPLISKMISTINISIDSLAENGLLFPADIVFITKGSNQISEFMEIDIQSKSDIIKELNKKIYKN